MKQKFFKKKLSLGKITVANLNGRDLKASVGGATPACTDPACSIEACNPPPTLEGKTCDTCEGYTCLTVEQGSCYGTICA